MLYFFCSISTSHEGKVGDSRAINKRRNLYDSPALGLIFKGAKTMRDLLFKNLTSNDKKRKMIASSEIMDRQGVRSIIRRHFVYIIKELTDNNIEKPLPYLYVLKEHNRLEQREKFFCKIKGSIYTVSKGKFFLIIFMHTLKITLAAIAQESMQYNEEDIT